MVASAAPSWLQLYSRLHITEFGVSGNHPRWTIESCRSQAVDRALQSAHAGLASVRWRLHDRPSFGLVKSMKGYRKARVAPEIPLIIKSRSHSSPIDTVIPQASYVQKEQKIEEATLLLDHAQPLLSTIQPQQQPGDPTMPHLRRSRQQQPLPSPQPQQPTPSPLRRIPKLDLAHLAATTPPANLHIQSLLALWQNNFANPRPADQDEAKLGRHAVR